MESTYDCKPGYELENASRSGLRGALVVLTAGDLDAPRLPGHTIRARRNFLLHESQAAFTHPAAICRASELRPGLSRPDLLPRAREQSPLRAHRRSRSDRPRTRTRCIGESEATWRQGLSDYLLRAGRDRDGSRRHRVATPL